MLLLVYMIVSYLIKWAIKLAKRKIPNLETHAISISQKFTKFTDFSANLLVTMQMHSLVAVLNARTCCKVANEIIGDIYSTYSLLRAYVPQTNNIQCISFTRFLFCLKTLPTN